MEATLIILGILVCLGFIVYSFVDLYHNDKLTRKQKTNWSYWMASGLVFGCIAYLCFGKPKEKNRTKV